MLQSNLFHIKWHSNIFEVRALNIHKNISETLNKIVIVSAKQN